MDKTLLGKGGIRNPPSGGKRSGVYARTYWMVVHPKKFIGRCDDLRGHIFNCDASIKGDQFITMLQEIAECIVWTYWYGVDINLTLEL